jgi:glycosyltransferase involved in cell wall biosynthesis
MEEELISVIIPIYNLELYIDSCLESVVNQTYKNIEIIIVNDGSSDNSEKIIRKWCEKDSRIKLINQENSGVSVARNTALDSASGKYITFVDGDDWLAPNCISKLYKSLKDESSDIVKCGYKFYNPITGRYRISNVKHHSLYGVLALKEFLSGNGVSSSVCGGLYKLSLFRKYNIRFTPGMSIGEDALITIKLLLKCEKLTLIPEIGYIIRIRNQSASRSKILISQEFDQLNNTKLLRKIENRYRDAYILRSMTSLLLKNAFNLTKNDYSILYEQLGYAKYNTSINRSVLAMRWKILSMVGYTRFGLFYLAKIMSKFWLRPEF